MKNNSLMHHGVSGQHWYTHQFGNWERHAKYANGRSNPESTEKRINTNKSSKTINDIKCDTYNLDKWGKDKEHNTLFITGYSGSGKSTIAESLKNKKTNVINLDLFTEQVGKESLKERDKEFVKFLSDNGSDYYKIADHEKYGIHFQTEEFGGLLDRFERNIKDFSRSQFDKGKKVAVEGVQLSDDTLFPDKSYFKDKPLIIPKTSAFSSFIRSGIRDDKLKLSDLTPSDIKEYITWYDQMAKNLDNVKLHMK